MAKTGLDIVVYSLCGFLANAGVVVTGFGHGVIFLFFVLIAIGAGYDHVNSTTVYFMQAISLAAVQPYMTFRIQPRKHFSKSILFLMVPPTILGTPIGAIWRSRTDNAKVAFIIAILLLGVGLFEIYWLLYTYNARDLLCPSFLNRVGETQQRCASIRPRKRQPDGVRDTASVKTRRPSGLSSGIFAGPGFRSLQETDGDSSIEGEFHIRLKEVHAYDAEAPVFFAIGSPRSGLQFLHTALNDRDDLACPPPAYTLQRFMPILDKFGDLSIDLNLEILVDHVCTFVERNPVPWTDQYGARLKFDRKSIADAADYCCTVFELERLECGDIDNGYYLMSIVDEIHNTYAHLNGMRTWFCKCLDIAKYHELLKKFYLGRLRYVYLVRDPRDVALSLKKSPVDDCHYHAIATKWNEVQDQIFNIFANPNDEKLVLEIQYEDLNLDKEATINGLNMFLDNLCKQSSGKSLSSKSHSSKLNRHSGNSSKSNRHSGKQSVTHMSFEDRNMCRRKSSVRNQKWLGSLRSDDIILLESLLLENMNRLGYEPFLVGKSVDPVVFTEEELAQFKEINDADVKSMSIDIRTAHLHQEEILKNPPVLIGSPDPFDVDNSDVTQKHDPCKTEAQTKYSYDWPRGAKKFGKLSEEEIEQRLELVEERTIELSDDFNLKVAALGQRGHFPFDKDRENQDVILVKNTLDKETEHHWLAVYGGHGPFGDKCAQFARDDMLSRFQVLKEDITMSGNDSDVQELMEAAHFATNIAMSEEPTVDDSKSGTTACTLYLQGRQCLIANVGNCCCVVGSSQKNSNLSSKPLVALLAKPLSKDHTPFRKEERERIKSAGGRICSVAQLEEMDTMHERWDSSESIDPPRVWAPDGNYPGTISTRSIGDSSAEKFGLSSKPDFIQHTVDVSDRVIILASGGLRKHLSNTALVNIAGAYDDPIEACRALVGEAYKRCAATRTDDFVDDISVLVAFVVPPSESESDTDIDGTVEKKRTCCEFLKKRKEERLDKRAAYIAAYRRDPSKSLRQINKMDIIAEVSSFRATDTKRSWLREFWDREVTYPSDKKRLRDFTWKNVLFVISMGFSAGFLGGMCGIRAPPLILFFMHCPVKLDKYSQRATGSVITRGNVYARMALYAWATYTNVTDQTYFTTEDWPMYLSLVVVSNSGVVVGCALFKRLKDSRAFIQTIMSIMLILCAIALFINSVQEIFMT